MSFVVVKMLVGLCAQAYFLGKSASCCGEEGVRHRVLRGGMDAFLLAYIVVGLYNMRIFLLLIIRL